MVCLEGIEVSREAGEGMGKEETREVSEAWKMVIGVSASPMFAQQAWRRTLGCA